MTSLLDQYEQNSQRSMGPVSPSAVVGSEVVSSFSCSTIVTYLLKGIAGKHSLHCETNDNGRLLAQLAGEQGLAIMSTFFEHKTIHKGTWKIPGTNRTNQIDHVLVGKRHATSISDIRACRGPNCDSDHFLVKVVMKERISLVENGPGVKRNRWNNDAFKNEEKVELYQRAIHENIETQGGLVNNGNINDLWNMIKGIINKAAENTVGKKRPEKNADCLTL